MENLDILKEAIESKKQIKYTYINSKKPEEKDFVRVGNPHIIFYSSSLKRKNDIILIHIFEIVKEKIEIKKWKPYDLEKMENIKIINKTFEPEETYKPNSFYYGNGFIKKIE
jgi:hypothetical protein